MVRSTMTVLVDVLNGFNDPVLLHESLEPSDIGKFVFDSY